jgi:intermediate filament protein if
MSIKTTVKTIERGIRFGPNKTSRSQDADLDVTPEQQIKKQLNAFVKVSEVEKKDLTKLNDRLGGYVDRVKALEAENFKLLKDIQDIQSRWGEGSKLVKQQFEGDLFNLRTRIDDTANLKAIADVKLKRAQYEINDMQYRYEDLVRLRDSDKSKIGGLGYELEQTDSSRRSIYESIEDQNADIEKYRAQRDNIWMQMNDLLDRLDDEVLKRVSTEYNNQTLKEHIEFIKYVHERQVNEMNQLSEALPFNDSVQFYKDELKRVVSSIRKDYEQLNQDQMVEIQEWMRIKSEELADKYNARDPAKDLEIELQAENMEKLRSNYSSCNNEIDDLKRKNELLQKRLFAIEEHVDGEKIKINETLKDKSDELEDLNNNVSNLLNDYNHLDKTKSSLEYEIQVYKRLLESQLNRMGDEPPKVDVQQATVSSGQFGGKVQNKKEKKGAVGIYDGSPDGKYIAIENSGGSSNTIADLSGWQLRRRVESNSEIVYQFPSGTLIPPNQVIKVWSRNYAQYRSGQDLVNTDVENWGIGMKSETRLVNLTGEDRSAFHQQITFGEY